MTLYIEYCAQGKPVNDFGLDAEFDFLLRSQNQHFGSEFIFQYSTENIFNRVRVGIVSGEISQEDVVFIFQGKEFSPNEYGAITNWPNGFCTLNGDMAEQILRGMVKLYKSKQNKE